MGIWGGVSNNSRWRKNSGAVSIRDHGGRVGQDVSAALDSAIDALGVYGGAVYFPGGRWDLEAPYKIVKDNIQIVGDGARTTELSIQHDFGYGLTVEHEIDPGFSYLSNFGMRNISMRARVATSGDSLLHLNKCQMGFFNNLSFEGHFGGPRVSGGLRNFWSGINVSASIASFWSSVQANSYFMYFGRSADGQVPTASMISNFNFRREEALDYIANGILIRAADGLWLNNGHVMGVDSSDIMVYPMSGVEQITGVMLNNIWLDNNATYGLSVRGATTAQYGEIGINGMRSLNPRENAIHVHSNADGFEGVRVNGFQSRKAGREAILLENGKSNIITDYDIASANRDDIVERGGITIGNGADSVHIGKGLFNQTGGGQTSAKMRGVVINSGHSGNIVVDGANFRLASTAEDIVDSSTVQNNKFVNITTDKSNVITTVSGSSLDIPEGGDVFQVSAGLTFDNMAGRWNERVVILSFLGNVTVNNGTIKLAGGATFNAKAKDTLTLMYSDTTFVWSEISRGVQ